MPDQGIKELTATHCVDVELDQDERCHGTTLRQPRFLEERVICRT
jgi:hypothetical protein